MASLAIAAGLVALYIAGNGQGFSAALFAGAAAAGAVAAAIDLRHQLLPDLGSAVIALTGLAAAAIDGHVIGSLSAGAVAAAILVLAALIVRRQGRGKPLGEGDVLLAGACGLWVTPEQIPIALLLAVAFTIVTGFVSNIGQGKRPTRFAFGPGLVAGFGLAATGMLSWGGAL